MDLYDTMTYVGFRVENEKHFTCEPGYALIQIPYHESCSPGSRHIGTASAVMLLGDSRDDAPGYGKWASISEFMRKNDLKEIIWRCTPNSIFDETPNFLGDIFVPFNRSPIDEDYAKNMMMHATDAFVEYFRSGSGSNSNLSRFPSLIEIREALRSVPRFE